MRSLLFGLVLAACGDTPSGTLMLMPDSHTIVVGQFTFVTAYMFDDTVQVQPMDPVVAEWSVEPASGIVSLSPVSNIQKITAIAVGSAVVTAVAFDQTAKTGFTIVAP